MIEYPLCPILGVQNFTNLVIFRNDFCRGFLICTFLIFEYGEKMATFEVSNYIFSISTADKLLRMSIIHIMRYIFLSTAKYQEHQEFSETKKWRKRGRFCISYRWIMLTLSSTKALWRVNANKLQVYCLLSRSSRQLHLVVNIIIHKSELLSDSSIA